MYIFVLPFTEFVNTSLQSLLPLIQVYMLLCGKLFFLTALRARARENMCIGVNLYILCVCVNSNTQGILWTNRELAASAVQTIYTRVQVLVLNDFSKAKFLYIFFKDYIYSSI